MITILKNKKILLFFFLVTVTGTMFSCSKEDKPQEIKNKCTTCSGELDSDGNCPACSENDKPDCTGDECDGNCNNENCKKKIQEFDCTNEDCANKVSSQDSKCQECLNEELEHDCKNADCDNKVETEGDECQTCKSKNEKKCKGCDNTENLNDSEYCSTCNIGNQCSTDNCSTLITTKGKKVCDQCDNAGTFICKTTSCNTKVATNGEYCSTCKQTSCSKCNKPSKGLDSNKICKACKVKAKCAKCAKSTEKYNRDNNNICNLCRVKVNCDKCATPTEKHKLDTDNICAPCKVKANCSECGNSTEKYNRNTDDICNVCTNGVDCSKCGNSTENYKLKSNICDACNAPANGDGECNGKNDTTPCTKTGLKTYEVKDGGRCSDCLVKVNCDKCATPTEKYKRDVSDICDTCNAPANGDGECNGKNDPINCTKDNLKTYEVKDGGRCSDCLFKRACKGNGISCTNTNIETYQLDADGYCSDCCNNDCNDVGHGIGYCINSTCTGGKKGKELNINKVCTECYDAYTVLAFYASVNNGGYLAIPPISKQIIIVDDKSTKQNEPTQKLDWLFMNKKYDPTISQTNYNELTVPPICANNELYGNSGIIDKHGVKAYFYEAPYSDWGKFIYHVNVVLSQVLKAAGSNLRVVHCETKLGTLPAYSPIFVHKDAIGTD